MQVVIEIPEEIGRALARGAMPPDRAALEGIAAEGYRSGLLSEHHLVRLLGLESRFDVHQWLLERRIPLQYTSEDLADDLETLRRLGLR